MTTEPDEASSVEHRLRREVEASFREARRLVYEAPPSDDPLTEEQKAALDRLHAAELSLEEHRTAQHRRRLDP
jgi:hypothetical protein